MRENAKRERRRLDRKQRQRDLAAVRQHEKPFLSTVRRLADAGWLAALAPLLERGYEPEIWRAAITDLCRHAGCAPGDAKSWELLEATLHDVKAPEHVIDQVLAPWMEAHPCEPTPHLRWLSRFVARGDWKLAALTALSALRTPAAGPLIEALEFRARRDVKYTRLLSEIAKARAERSIRTGRPDPEKRRAARPSPPRTPPPQADPPPPAPLIAEAIDCRPLLDKLLGGVPDSLAGLELAFEAVELLAADHFDRLLCLPMLRGIDRLEHQIETVFRVLKRFRGRVLLADEVGLGKTIEAAIVLKEYLVRGLVKRALVLVPPALVGQWRAELEEKFSVTAATTHDAAFRSDPDAFWARDGVLIASLAAARGSAHRETLSCQTFDIVIVDEAHHLKNRRTRAFELVDSLRSRFFLLLTATPVETHIEELYSLVTLLRPGTLGTEGEFRRRFVRRSDPTSPRDPEALRALLREVMIRNTRAACGVLLPPRTARTIVVGPTPPERDLYAMILEATRELGQVQRTLFRTLLEEAGSSPRAVAVTARRVRQSADDARLAAALGRLEDLARTVERTAKLERLGSLLDGDKVLVFSRFRSTMEEIASDLERRGVPMAAFHGGMSAVERDAAVADFAADRAHVLLCSEIGGEGRNLQFCRRLINYDLPWNPMLIEQRIGRIHRIGQTGTVEVTNLAGAGTAEERILDVLDRRVNLFELVVGEMDLLLGDVTEERDFGDQVFDIYASSRSDGDIDRGFDLLAGRLLEARGRFEKVKALDEDLFGEGYEA